MPIVRTLNQDFFKTWSPEMAYVLGYFAADGCMICHKNGGRYIEFTSTDYELLDQLKHVTSSHNVISKRAYRSKHWKTQYRIQIGSKRWFEDLTTLGFTANKSKSLPVMNVPNEYFGDFVRGYFDGDGCIYFKKHWSKWHKNDVWVFTSSFTSGSRSFLEMLHSKFKERTIVGGHIATKARGFALVLSRHDSLALYDIMYNTSQVSGLFLGRKRDLFQQAFQTLYMRP